MTIATRGDIVSILSHFHEVLDTHDGCQLSNEVLWGLSPCQGTPSSIALSPNDFKCLRMKIGKLSGILKVLRGLTRSLDDDLSAFELKVNTVALHQGLGSVPDEILAIIFEYAVENIEDSCHLSLVCTRFRSVMQSSPRIWAGVTLTGYMSSSQVVTVVNRSRGLLLSANIGGSLNEVEKGLNTILLHSSELLEELHINHVAYAASYWRRFSWEQLSKLHLPHLRILLLRHDYSPPSLSQICSSWTMPRLQILDTYSIPLPMHGSNLIRCSLTFCKEVNGGLLDFLASAPLLQDLQLAFVQSEEWPETRTEAVILPNLKSMTLSVGGVTSPSLLHIILSRLHTDNLSDLSVKLKKNWNKCDLPVLQFISQQHSLLHLNVVFCLHGCTDTIFGRIDRVFTDLPSSIPTPKVDLELPGMKISWDTTSSGFMVPAIRRLCRDLTIEDLRRGFCTARGTVADVRSVGVVRCSNINEAKLRELFSDVKDIRILPLEG